ncbi:hypothetical protein D3C71_1643920 [compost metagenome]
MADGDQRDAFTLGDITRQQRVGAAAFDKNGFIVVNQRGGILRQLLLEGEVGHHARIDIIAF